MNFTRMTMALSSMAYTPCDLRGARKLPPITGSSSSPAPIRLMIFRTRSTSVS